MAIVRENIVTSQTDATTYSNTIDVGTNADRFVVLWFRVDGSRTISSASIDGNAATQVDSVSAGGILFRLYYAPVSSTGSVSVSVVTSSFGGTKSARIHAYSGVSSIRGGDVVATGSNTNNPAVTLTTEADDLLVLFGYDSLFGTTFSANSPATAVSTAGSSFCAEETATTTSTTIDGTLTANAPWRVGAIAMIPAGGGGGGPSIAAISNFYRMMRSA